MLPNAPLWSIRDTRLAACAFSKCALWAKHAVVVSKGPQPVDELCSVFRVCRIKCLYDDPRQIRQKLSTISQDKLYNAMQHLQMPICRHLQLGNIAVTSHFDPGKTVIIPQRDGIYGALWPQAAGHCFDTASCENCRAEGTYPTWGFFARPYKSEISLGGVIWLDIELSLSRPYVRHYPYDEISSYHNPWDAHCIAASIMSTFVDSWWKWARKVAEEGLDWRARPPSGFLEANRSALVSFPEQIPPYKEHDPHSGGVENEQPSQDRAFSRADCSTWRLTQHHPSHDWYVWGLIPKFIMPEPH